MSQEHTNTDRSLTISELPAIARRLFAHTNTPLQEEPNKHAAFFIRYLRRKPERGLAIIYTVTATNKRQHAPSNTVSLTLDERALHGSRILFDTQQVQDAPCTQLPSGVLHVPTLGLALQTFPADHTLPALTACCDVVQDSTLWQEIEKAAHLQLGNICWRLTAVQATPVRYKPASRCVIRYELTLEQNESFLLSKHHVTLFGKVYADPQQAQQVQAVQQALYQEQLTRQEHNVAQVVFDFIQKLPFLPRPLGINVPLGITLNQAIRPKDVGASLVSGGNALRPRLLYGRGGEVAHVVVPVDELRLTARALAHLHTSSVRPAKTTPRTGAKEATRVRERTQRIAAANPNHAAAIETLAHRLIIALEAQQPDAYRPAHGGFKASQLLFHSQRVFVVDFDGFCLADAALDVGYFLAYLRPSDLWYGRAGMRSWFEAASGVFVDTYRQAMLALSQAPACIEGIIQRASLYEAALLFKIATRRVNRLNSPRPQELGAMLKEITICLVDA